MQYVFIFILFFYHYFLNLDFISHKRQYVYSFSLFIILRWFHWICQLLSFLFLLAASIIEVNRKRRHWMVKGSQRVYVRYGCWRFSAFEPMEFSHMGAMCMEILTPLQGFRSFRVSWSDISFWLWKGPHYYYYYYFFF